MTDATTSTIPLTDSADRQGFSVFDPALPLLAAKAALQLDQLRIDPSRRDNPDIQVDAVQELQHLLQGTADSTCYGGPRAFVDPLSARVLHEAVSEYGAKRIESFEELWIKLRELLALLKPATLYALRTEQLESVRDFFVALSNHAATGQNARARVRPTSQYRKIRMI